MTAPSLANMPSVTLTVSEARNAMEELDTGALLVALDEAQGPVHHGIADEAYLLVRIIPNRDGTR